MKNNKGCPFTHQTAQCPLNNNEESSHDHKFDAEQFDAFDTPYQIDPALALKYSRDKLPVFYSEKMGYWIVSRYDDIKTVFRDPILFSPRNVLEKVTPATPEQIAVLKSYNYDMSRTLVNEDEPAHMERRRALMDHFLPANLASKQTMIRKLTREKIDTFINLGRVDLIEGLLYEVPLLVALHFLGVPEDEISKLKTFSIAHSVNTWGKPTADQQIKIAHDVGQFWQYASEIIEKMRLEPEGIGWMHHTIRKNAEIPDIVPDSYVHSMMMAVIVAAHETTSLASANMFRTLLSNREAWDDICADPSLIPNAVEECLRYSGSIVAWRRESTKETILAGVNIPAGAKLLIVQASGNRDENHFENADKFDIYRENTAEHLTFGYGAHQCMGKNIGRMEMRIFLEEITRRIPHLKLAKQNFEYSPSTSFRGPEEVWVEWNPQKNPERYNTSIKDTVYNFDIGAPKTKDITRKAKIVSLNKEADNILVINLVDSRGRTLPNWSAGSHIELIAGGFSRKYSLCGKTDENTYKIAILKEENGKGGSRYFHENLIEGMQIKFRGPSNCFHLEKNSDNYVLIAGGIGITPILAMADTLKKLHKSYNIHYAGKTRKSMAFLSRIESDHSDNVTLYIKEEGNRANLANIINSIANPKTKIYTCGPLPMIEELKILVKNLPNETLHFESFSGALSTLDPKKENEFQVELLDSGLTLTVAKDKTLLDVIESAGIDISSDCREGLCGVCEVSVNNGNIDHRDVVLTDAEKKSKKKMMACCSRTINGSKLTINL